MSKTEHQEIEFVYTDIDVDDIRNRLEGAGAQFVFDETYDMTMFEYPGWPLDKKGSWVRLRQIKDKEITLAYKERITGEKADGTDDLGMKEVEIEVSNFETTQEFLFSLGMVVKKRMEKRRIRYMLGTVEFDIDFQPLLSPFLEVEGNSEEEIDVALKQIGLDQTAKRIINNFFIYKENGIDLHEYKVLTFTEQKPYSQEDKMLRWIEQAGQEKL